MIGDMFDLTYLYYQDDAYSLNDLKQQITTDGDLNSITLEAYENCKTLFNLNVDGVKLTDQWNQTIVDEFPKSRVPLGKPPATLFAPQCLINDPDIFQKGKIGWPVQNKAIQDEGYNDFISQDGSYCETFTQDCFLRESPYRSHCSSFFSWAIREVYSLQTSRVQIGNWCTTVGWIYELVANNPTYAKKVDVINAQIAANQGKFVFAIVVVNPDNPNSFGQNGHIGIVLPMNWQMGRLLQRKKKGNFPKNPVISDSKSFQQYLKLNGPDVQQSGALNFRHTPAMNAFAHYYPKGQSPGSTPIDEVVQFYIFTGFTQRPPNSSC